MSYLVKATSLKRQSNTILAYFPKKSPCSDLRGAATTSEGLIPVIEDPVTPQTSSPDASVDQQVVTEHASVAEHVHPNDLGIYAGKSITDEKRKELLTSAWTPAANFPFKPTGTRNLKFQYQWLQRWNWLVYSKN